MWPKINMLQLCGRLFTVLPIRGAVLLATDEESSEMCYDVSVKKWTLVFNRYYIVHDRNSAVSLLRRLPLGTNKHVNTVNSAATETS